jgi:flagellar biosynthesis protein FlhB
MATLIGLLVTLLIGALIFWLLWWALNAITALLPPPIAQVVRVIGIVILVLFAISFLTGGMGFWDAPWAYHHYYR